VAVLEKLRIDTGEAVISVSRGGTGPGVLLLHGFPETQLMWRDIAPRLAQRFTVVCADLRGYGDSSTPPSSADHAPYSKRAMARDMISVMAQLGLEHFSIAGHDRGGRVAYRAALDHPDRVDALAVMDVLPVDAVWDRADARLALGFWPWSLLAQPEPLPERLIGAAPDAVIGNALSPQWGSPADAFDPAVRAAYTAALSDAAHIHAVTTTPPTAQRAAASPARYSPSGARPDRCRPGTTTMAGRSRCGANSPPT